MELRMPSYQYIRSVAVVIILCFFLFYLSNDRKFMNYYQYLLHKSNIPKNPVKTDKGSINNRNQRHDCGVILHVHINKCAGGTVIEWFEKHAPTLKIGCIMHNQQVKKNREKYKHENISRYSQIYRYEPEWRKMIQQVDRFLASVSSNTGWKVLEVHNFTPGLMLIRNYIEKWEKSVEARGCIFYKTTILRDPLDRFISNVNYVRAPLRNIDSFMESRRNWIIRYLLFGICGYKGKHLKCEFQPDGSYTSTPNLNETLMKQIYDVTNSLDLVGFTDNLDGYYEKIRQITGWKNKVKNVKRLHKSSSTFNLTRSLISKFIDLNQNDYIFYYAMKNKYSQHF